MTRRTRRFREPVTTTEGPRRERRPALTREQVLAAALALVDADGVEALSMRRLGRAIDRDPMRLYRHAPSKDALLDGVVELVLAPLRVPAVVDGDWESALRTTAHAFRDVAVAHPHVIPLLVTRPLATPLGLRPPGTLRLLEDVLELLVGAGFDAPGALHAARHYLGFLHGHVLDELQERVHDPEETDALLRLGLHRLPAREFPRLRSLAAELLEYDGAHEMDEGLDIVLAGLRRQVGAAPERPGDDGGTSGRQMSGPSDDQTRAPRPGRETCPDRPRRL
jgi:AcrR family transcriptional regulator